MSQKARPGDSISSETDFSMLEFASFVLRAWRWILLYVALASVVTVWQYERSPSYTASGVFMIDSGQNDSAQAFADKIGGIAANEDREEVLAKYLMILNSQVSMESVASFIQKSPDLAEFERLAGIQPGTDSEVHSRVVDALFDLVSFSKYATDTIRVSVTLPDPHAAVRVGGIVLAAVEKSIEDRETNNLESGRKFLEGQADEVSQRLKKIDEEIQARSLATDGASYSGRSGGQGSDIDRRISELQAKVMNLKIAINQNDSLIQDAEGQISRTSGGVSSIDKYSPQVVLSDLRRKGQELSVQYDAYSKMLDTLRKQEKNLPLDESEIAGLYKKMEMEYQMYNEIEHQIMAIGVEKISAQDKVKTLEVPTVNDVSSRYLIPNLIKRGIFALLLACLTVYLLENYNPLLTSRRSLKGLRLTYLGSIPDLNAPGNRVLGGLGALFRRRGRVHPMHAPFHAMDIKPDSFYDLVFKNIRAQLVNFRIGEKKSPKVISVTSPHTGEGKSSVASNLAKSLAMGRNRVLLVDCDLRKRSVTRAWKLEHDSGLIEYLAAPDAEFKKPIVRKIAHNLELLPAGQYSPECSELIFGENFADLIAALSKFYDFIVLDTPPAVPYSEVIPISTISDLVILSLTVDQTSIESIHRTLEKLRFVSQKPVAYVLNKHNAFDIKNYYSYRVDLSESLPAA